MWIIISEDRNYGGTKIWGFFSEIQYEISEIQYENMGIFSKNPRISYHINMSRKVLGLLMIFLLIYTILLFLFDNVWLTTEKQLTSSHRTCRISHYSSLRVATLLSLSRIRVTSRSVVSPQISAVSCHSPPARILLSCLRAGECKVCSLCDKNHFN